MIYIKCTIVLSAVNCTFVMCYFQISERKQSHGVTLLFFLTNQHFFAATARKEIDLPTHCFTTCWKTMGKSNRISVNEHLIQFLGLLQYVSLHFNIPVADLQQRINDDQKVYVVSENTKN